MEVSAGHRGTGWTGTIFEQRHQIDDILRTSPSLRSFFVKQVANQYLSGRPLASKETGIAFGLFPDECPFTPEQVLDLEFFPEDRSIE